MVWRYVAVLAAAAFMWVLVLSASPGLHHRIHGGGDLNEYACAVTYVQLGSYLHSVSPGHAQVAQRADQFATVPELTSRWVPSPFLGARIFEHAPPPLS